jgi:thiamine pyrophosphate-dependent acetolactate synthase large subunit-like protein
MYFHEAVAQALADAGLGPVFGVLGDANLYMMDSFQRLAGGRYYSFSNEVAGVLAAAGYARVSGRLGVATVTHGPAFTNTVTALVDSVRARTPLLLIAGDTAAADLGNLQNIGQREIAEAAGAGFVLVRSPHTLAEDLATAIGQATAESRPVVLDVPVDFQWQEVSYRAAPPPTPRPAAQPDLDELGRAAGILASARRPFILAGRGATSDQARAALMRLAERAGAPVATTLRAKDLFRGHPFDLGICGTLADAVTLETILSSDCVIAFGATLNRHTTADRSLVDGKRVVQVDTNRDAIGHWSPVDAGVAGDSATVAGALVDMLDEAGVKPTSFASDELAQKLADPSRHAFTEPAGDHTVGLRTALRRIDDAFPSERTLVIDAGRFIGHAFRMLHVPDPSAYVHTVNFGSIGLGMGSAIGAALAAPGRPALLVCGDGGFMLGGLAEFSTAVRHGIDLVVVVLNDGAYGAEHVQFRSKNMDPAISMFDWPDFGPVATALGGQGYTARTASELDAVLAALPGLTRPVLIDVKLDPDAVPDGRH